MIELRLPWPPSVNDRATPIGRRLILTAKYRQYLRTATFEILSQKPRGFPAGSSIGLNVFVYPPDRRRRDIDNLIKVVADSLQHSRLIADDADIDDIHIVRRGVLKGGQLLLQVWSA